jgi:hypothetical protein
MFKISVLSDAYDKAAQIGLFSAIVTAFFIASFAKLQPDQSALTNELLLNLTNVVLAIHNVSFDSTGLPTATPYVPDSSNVRQNVLWSLSLSMSVRVRLLPLE